MSRSVKILVTDGGQQIHDLSGNFSTWGDIKTEMSRKGLNTSSIKGLVKGIKVTLEDDRASLPDGDLVIFVTGTKVKSGARLRVIPTKSRTKVEAIYALLQKEASKKK